MEPGRRTRVDSALAALVVALPVALAALHALPSPDYAHDVPSLRVVGLGYAGPFHAVDALFASFALALPFGTESFRASLAGAVAAGLAGAVLYAMTRDLLARLAPPSSLAYAVAAVASLAATLSPAWQLEAGVVGGAALGASLAFAPAAALGSDEGQIVQRLPRAALFLGLALSYDPVVASAALLGLVPWLVARGVALRALRGAIAPFALGAVPWLYALARSRASVFALGSGLAVGKLGDEPLLAPASPVPFLHDQVGWLALVLAVVGAALAILAPKARRAGLSVLLVALAGIVGVATGFAAGPTHFAAASLVAVAALFVLAGVAMHALLLAVSRAEVPFARASAVMVLLLELTFPAIAADDAGLRAEARERAASAPWDDLVLARLPSRGAMLLADPRLVRHFAASRARGALRGDVSLVALRDLGGRAALRELSRDADLAPLFRDMALRGAPGEFALASLAAKRAVAIEIDRAWEKPLTRHLVPEGFLDRFSPEPRAGSDRKRGLDAFLPERQAMAKLVTAPRDEAACAMLATLLRARLYGLAAAGEREMLPRAVDDLRAFAPEDPLANAIVKRVATTRGPLDVEGLPP